MTTKDKILAEITKVLEKNPDSEFGFCFFAIGPEKVSFTADLTSQEMEGLISFLIRCHKAGPEELSKIAEMGSPGSFVMKEPKKD